MAETQPRARRRRLIESLRRRADFDPSDGRSVPVRMADGQDWFLPKPFLELAPVFQNGMAVDRTRILTCGPELDALLEAIAAEPDGIKQALAVMTLGAFLLARNYDLEDEEYSRLFVHRVGDPESHDRLRTIVDVATGKLSRVFGKGGLRDPKRRAGGFGSA